MMAKEARLSSPKQAKHFGFNIPRKRTATVTEELKVCGQQWLPGTNNNK